jgi:hypothetical protein
MASRCILVKDTFAGCLVDQGNRLGQQGLGCGRVTSGKYRSKLLDLSPEPASTCGVHRSPALVLPISFFGRLMVWHSSPLSTTAFQPWPDMAMAEAYPNEKVYFPVIPVSRPLH